MKDNTNEKAREKIRPSNNYDLRLLAGLYNEYVVDRFCI